jgi:DNA-binding IscR family transcriptional regulator
MGTRGGFTLRKSPAEISLKQVYECLEGPLLLMECLEERERVCRYCAVCNQISVWHEAQQLLAKYLASISLQQIADKAGLREELAHWGHKSYGEPLRAGTTYSGEDEERLQP